MVEPKHTRDHPASTLLSQPLGAFEVTDYVGGRGPIQSLVEGLSIRRMTSTVSATETIALGDETVRRHLTGLNVRKVIVVQDRIVNIVAG